MRRCALGLSLLLFCPACTNNDVAPPDLNAGDMRMPEPLAIACSDGKDAVYQLPAGLPPFDSTRRGDVIRCSYERYVAAADANAALNGLGYTGPAVTNGMDVYRIAFRTQRSAPAVTPDGGAAELGGFSSARVFLPDQQNPAAYAVVGHGTLGEGASCADSVKDVLDPTLTQSAKILDLTLAGNGFITIEPDYSGYGYGQEPHGWYLAEDEAHAFLDATRAMKNLLQPSALPAQVAFVGHSQGSHVVLAAQSMAKSYGMEGQLIGVAPMGLLWFSGLTWGAALSSLAGLTTQNDSAALSYAMFFFYGHGELYDGPGGGLAMFQASKRAAVQTFLQNQCEADATAVVPTFGATPADFFDSAFVSAMENCTVLQTNCNVEPAATWSKRMLADRPAIDPQSAPIVVWHGALDKDIPPARAQCGIDKLQSDLSKAGAHSTTLTICGDAGADHSGVVQRNADWIAQWVAARAAGQPDPPGCPGAAPLQPAGGTLTCATPPSNQ
jgi:hypothetical protein